MKFLSKKGFVLSILSLTLIAVIIIGGTVAFFTDSDELVNTFTMGDVEIGLDEPGWEEDDGLDLLPGNVRTKDPTVTAEKGESYMRIRMEIVDGGGELISDSERIALILNSLYYDAGYATAMPNIKESQKYSSAELQALIDLDKINVEYNRTDFAFAGIETGKPGVRYYNYITNGGIFDASKTPADKAVLFSNVILAKDWNNEEIYILNGDTYTTTANGAIELISAGKGYRLVIIAEAIQSAELPNAAAAFAELDAAMGISRDISGI